MKLLPCLVISFVLSSLLAQTSLACSPPRPPQPGQENKNPAQIITSDNGLYLLKMIPPLYKRDNQGYLVVVRQAYGEAFKITPDGKLEPIWKIPLDYVRFNSFDGSFLLTDDGIHLIQIRRASSLDDKKAMIVYNRGKAFRSYSPRTFMPKLSRLQTTTCGNGPWLKSAERFTAYSVKLLETSIAFETIDNQKWLFDVRKPPALASKDLAARW